MYAILFKGKGKNNSIMFVMKHLKKKVGLARNPRIIIGKGKISKSFSFPRFFFFLKKKDYGTPSFS
jgi:hypothetical protein